MTNCYNMLIAFYICTAPHYYVFIYEYNIIIILNMDILFWGT